MLQKKTKFMRRCHKCDEIYSTTCKFGKICDNCKIPCSKRKSIETKTTSPQMAAQKKWREKNREKVNTYSRKYYFEKQGE